MRRTTRTHGHTVGKRFSLTYSDGFVFSPLEGGTVDMSFRIAAHPSTDQIGRLSELIQHEITLTLIEPEANAA